MGTAINKAGKSDPSHPSRSKEAQPRSLPPLIDAKNLHDVVVIAGDRVKFDLPFQGIPVPDVIWTLNGDEENHLATSPDKNMIITVTGTGIGVITFGGCITTNKSVRNTTIFSYIST